MRIQLFVLLVIISTKFSAQEFSFFEFECDCPKSKNTLTIGASKDLVNLLEFYHPYISSCEINLETGVQNCKKLASIKNDLGININARFLGVFSNSSQDSISIFFTVSERNYRDIIRVKFDRKSNKFSKSEIVWTFEATNRYKFNSNNSKPSINWSDKGEFYYVVSPTLRAITVNGDARLYSIVVFDEEFNELNNLSNVRLKRAEIKVDENKTIYLNGIVNGDNVFIQKRVNNSYVEHRIEKENSNEQIFIVEDSNLNIGYLQSYIYKKTRLFFFHKWNEGKIDKIELKLDNSLINDKYRLPIENLRVHRNSESKDSYLIFNLSNFDIDIPSNSVKNLGLYVSKIKEDSLFISSEIDVSEVKNMEYHF